VSETTESAPDAPDTTIDTTADEPGLKTFDEMLPAARAFYRSSSKT
jgi:hypothetical protein